MNTTNDLKYQLDLVIQKWLELHIKLNHKKQKETPNLVKNYRELLNVLFNALTDYVYFILINRTNKPNAQDITSKVLIKIYKNLHKFNGTTPEEFKSWVYKITLNTYTDWLRKQKIIRKFIPFSSILGSNNKKPHATNTEEIAIENMSNNRNTTKLTESSSNYDLLESNMTKIEVQRLMEKLSPQDKDLIMLRYFYGHTHKEIAKITGKTEIAVRKKISRTIAGLRKLIKPNDKQHRN